ncbi:hypothetical protein F5X96DRAFT_284402 [Biscogniauxia mediterranea]|nr:hypothetical protein F5X96DRAFT_284402 [Biscogniauxia mediterranea]
MDRRTFLNATLGIFQERILLTLARWGAKITSLLPSTFLLHIAAGRPNYVTQTKPFFITRSSCPPQLSLLQRKITNIIYTKQNQPTPKPKNNIYPAQSSSPPPPLSTIPPPPPAPPPPPPSPATASPPSPPRDHHRRRRRRRRRLWPRCPRLVLAIRHQRPSRRRSRAPRAGRAWR